MTAAPDNPRGFWESTVLMALNDDILAAGASTWTDWRRFDAGRIEAAQEIILRERARTTLVDEFGDAPVPIVKDPRMCRLMGFWAPVFEELVWSPRVVLPVRSPLEVAWSLRGRDGSSGVAAGCLLWLRHVLDAEADTRGMKRAVLDWSRFLQDWPGSLGPVAERLNLSLARADDPGAAGVDDFVSPGLRRFAASRAELDADPAVTELAREVYAAMLDLVDDADCSATLRQLDALRVRFDEAVEIFDSAMREREARNRDLERQLLAQPRDLAEKLADLAERLAEADRRACRQDEALARANAFINRHARGTSSKSDRRWPLARSSRSPRDVNGHDLSTIRNSPFFDEAYYFDRRPDVRAAGADAALHYLVLGWREGCDPGPCFSTAGYLARNPDVATVGLNPLVHYETRGRKENRAAISEEA